MKLSHGRKKLKREAKLVLISMGLAVIIQQDPKGEVEIMVAGKLQLVEVSSGYYIVRNKVEPLPVPGTT